MRAALVTLNLVAMACILSVMGQRAWDPTEARSGCGADEVDAAKRKPAISVTNRVWRDKVPKDGRDVTFHMVLLDKVKVRTGAFAHLSQWRFHVDRVRYRLEGDTLHVESPQDDAKWKMKVRTWKCKGEAPAPFDLCLELSRGLKKIRLYSQKNAHFGAGEVDRALLEAAAPDADAPACAGCEERVPAWMDALLD